MPELALLQDRQPNEIELTPVFSGVFTPQALSQLAGVMFHPKHCQLEYCTE